MEEQKNFYLIPGAIVIAALIIGGAFLYSKKNPSPASLTSLNQEQENFQFDVKDEPTLGNSNSKVTMIEFSDFQCPFCAIFHQTAFGQIREKYIDSGKIKYVVKDFPLEAVHPFARGAAEAARCANEQNKFFEFQDLLFENQDRLSASDLKNYAVQLGLNSQNFNQCADSRKYKEAVEQNLKEATEANLRGTPTFFINGRMIAGALPFSEFEKIIEEELKK